MFNIYAMPVLLYCSEIFKPQPNSNLCIILEQPLKKFTREICQRCGISYITYADRLLILDTKSIYERTITIDILQLYKIVTGLTYVPSHPIILYCRPLPVIPLE